MFNFERFKSSDSTPIKDEADVVKQIGLLRAALEAVRETAEALKAHPLAAPCGRELSLLITEAQSARHWGGECLGKFDTGFKKSDLPGEPETATRLKK